MTHHSDVQPAGSPVEYVFDIWRRRKWLAISIFALVLAVTASAALSLPDLYLASATVLVERQQVSEDFVKSTVTDELETRIQTIQQQVMSRARLSDLIQRLNLYGPERPKAPLEQFAEWTGFDRLLERLRGPQKPAKAPSPDALVERMRLDAPLTLKSMEQGGGGHALTIAFRQTFSGRDPQVVAAVANTLAGYYVSENTRTRERQATETAAFLKQQLASAKQDVDSRQRRINNYKIGFSDQLQPVEVNLTAMERINTQLRVNADAQIRLMERRQALEQQLTDLEAGGPPTLAASQALTPAAQLTKARQELTALRQRYSDQYPDVVRKRGEVADLEREVATLGAASENAVMAPSKASTKVLKDSMAEVDRQRQALKQEESSLRQMAAKYEASAQGTPKRQQELLTLSRDFDVVNERYQTLAKRFEEAQLAETLEEGRNTEQFRILDAAIPPARPAAPNRLWLILLAFASSAGLGLGAMVIAEKLDPTFHTVDDLRSFTNVPALATIRHIPTRAETRRRRLVFTVMTVVIAIVFVVLAIAAYQLSAGNEQLVRLMLRPAA
jgi:uncharacterized protein involved in exopolysaccharide biosynthesis